jgi:hypothetical protein
MADLSTAAHGGPVVVINVSAYRCDALTVTGDNVQVTPLPTLTAVDVTRRVPVFLDALRQTPTPGRDLAAIPNTTDPNSADQVVSDTIATERA